MSEKDSFGLCALLTIALCIIVASGWCTWKVRQEIAVFRDLAGIPAVTYTAPPNAGGAIEKPIWRNVLRCSKSRSITGVTLVFVGTGEREERAAFERLAQLPDLQFVSLINATDRHLMQTSRLTLLRELWVDGSDITPMGMEAIGRLDNLETLAIMAGPISEAELKPICHLNLRSLSLLAIDKNDSITKPVTEMESLKSLSIPASGLSDGALGSLQEHLPQCRVLVRDDVPCE